MGNDEERPVRRGHRAIAIAMVSIFLIACTLVGAILIPEDGWPGSSKNWLLSGLGAVLIVAATLIGAYAQRIVEVLAKAIVRLRIEAGNVMKNPRRLVFSTLPLVVVLLVWVAPIPWLNVFVAAESDIEEGPLVVMSAFDESPSDPRRLLLNQWNQTHPGSPVRIKDVTGEPDEQHASFVNDVAKEHEADVYVLDIVWMAEFIKHDYIQPLDESRRTNKDTDFLPNVLATARDSYGGKEGLWGLPFNTDAGLMYRRSDVPDLDKPDDWEDYFGVPAASTLEAVRQNPELSAMAGTLRSANAASYANEETLTVTALEAMWAAGGEVVNKDGRFVFNQSGEVKFDDRALEGLRNLATALRNPDIVQPDAEEADEDKAVRAFKSRETLFMRNWPLAYDKLMTSGSTDAVPFEVSALPHASVLGGQNLAISKNTNKPKAAQALIEFLTNPSSQLILFQVGGFAPTQVSVYANDPRSSRTYLQDLRSAIEQARSRPIIPCYAEFTKEFRKGINRALKNDGEIEADFPRLLAKFGQC
jgi:multiple sugar transport system substrate-binding protein